MCFNGEIYNFQKLKRKLENKKSNFQRFKRHRSSLESWNIWGSKTLRYLNGMFAFAIWDKLNKKLFIARDRIGEKPLYYSLEKKMQLILHQDLHVYYKLDKKIQKFFNTRY